MSVTGMFLMDVIGVFTALIAILIAYYKWTFQYWQKKNVPYLEPSIPFGNIQNPINKTLSLGTEIHEIYKELKPRAPKYFGLFMMASPNFVPVDLELVKQIMTKDFRHFVDRGTYVNEKDDPVGAHLFAIGGTKWKNLRAKLTPTFTSGKMKSMFQTLVDCGLILEEYMETVDNQTAVDIKDVLGRYATDIIGSCAFGIKCNSFKEPDSPFRRYGTKIFESTPLRSLRSLVAFNFQNLGRALGIRQIPKDVGDFFAKVVHDTVNHREKNGVVRKDFLQLLIDLKDDREGVQNEFTGDGKSLTMDEMVAQSFVFFIAGFETSSTTMTFALYELATHPNIQERVRKEIHEVLGKYNNEITYESINEMQYMGQVLDETLRKYPPVPFLTRRCVEDYKVPGEDLIIEKGTRVIIPVLGIHYDEKYYKDPEVFDPDRFTEENKKNRHQYAHLPFGEGPRVCIGLRFGVMQSKVGLTCLLKNFRVKVAEKTKLPIKMAPRNFVPSTDGGMWLNFEKIK